MTEWRNGMSTAAEKATALAEIARIEGRIRECRQAKKSVDKVRKKLIDKRDELNDIHEDLNEKKVEKTDIFEGNMAESLECRVKKLEDMIDLNINLAEAVGDKLKQQSNNIDTAIAKLEGEKRKQQAIL